MKRRGAATAQREKIARRFFDAGGSDHVTVALGTGEQHEIWELRHAASPILSRLDPSLKSMQFIEDGAFRPSGSPSTCAACARRSTRAAYAA